MLLQLIIPFLKSHGIAGINLRDSNKSKDKKEKCKSLLVHPCDTAMPGGILLLWAYLAERYF